MKALIFLLLPLQLLMADLSILTYNVCALPGRLPRCFGNMPPASERMEEIKEFILEQDADLVCLQETWDPTLRGHLIKGLKENYPYIHTKIGYSWWGLDSGLFIVSKHPILDPEHIPYSVKGQDLVIHRGVFTFKIGPHKIGVTHMQSGLSKKEIRRQQVAQIPSDCAILIGDLNTRQPGEFAELFGDNYYENSAGITHEEREVSLDYILTKEDIVQQIEVIPTDHSDHSALLAYLAFQE